ncbi:MAG: hypothetical protein ACO1O6_01890 [Bacteroidota bacterium]
MEKIAVVGLGWLGLPLGFELLASSYRVSGTTTSPGKLDSLQGKGFELSLLDLNKGIDKPGMQAFFDGTSICIINLPPGKSIFQSYKNQCLELIALFPAYTKFIFISSTSVYSDKVSLAQENTAVLTDYNFSSQLFQAEKALKMELKDRLTILRLAGLFGENRNPARHLSGKSGLKNPGGAVNLVHQRDCISFILEVIRQECWGEVFNVCASDHPPRELFYSRMCEKEGWDLPAFDVDEPMSVSKIVSNEKGKHLLNFTYDYDSPFDF